MLLQPSPCAPRASAHFTESRRSAQSDLARLQQRGAEQRLGRVGRGAGVGAEHTSRFEQYGEETRDAAAAIFRRRARPRRRRGDGGHDWSGTPRPPSR